VNLQFSCSFFLQGEGAPNGRLSEQVGRCDVLDVAWEALDSAMCEERGRSWKLLGGCCPENCSWDRELQSWWRWFPEFRRIRRDIEFAGLPGYDAAAQRAVGTQSGGGDCIVTCFLYLSNDFLVMR
jgi:hypothetical protein